MAPAAPAGTWRTDRAVVQAQSDDHPDTIEDLEPMLLDGTEERGDVAAYVTAVFGSRFS